jgi:hypothetical protein
MPIGRDVSLDHNLVADDPLDRKPAAINLGRDPLDDDPIPPFTRQHGSSS